MWADEKLLALKPNEAEYQDRLAGTRYNIGLRLSAAESSRKHSSGTSRRGPWRRKWPRWIPTMFARNTRSRSIKRVFAHALFKTGSIEKARVLFLECDRILEGVFERDNSLRTQYALGVNAVRLGELYAHLAENSRAGRSAQLDLWRQARDSLQRGVASLQNVTANATLPSVDMVDVRDGVAIAGPRRRHAREAREVGKWGQTPFPSKRGRSSGGGASAREGKVSGAQSRARFKNFLKQEVFGVRSSEAMRASTPSVLLISNGSQRAWPLPPRRPPLRAGNLSFTR